MFKKLIFFMLSVTALASVLFASPLLASEADLNIPNLPAEQNSLLMWGLLICILGMLFGVYMYAKVKRLPAHQSMLDISNIIFQTCKTYLLQQGKLLLILELFIGACIVYYFGFLQHVGANNVVIILAWSVVGILGSYSVAWFGIRMNTLANSRMAFASLEGKPIKLLGVGEKWDALEDFHPQRIAGRILGMGDVVSLVEKAAQSIDAAQAAKMAEKMRKGVFDLNDLSEQLAQIEKLGGMGGDWYM